MIIAMAVQGYDQYETGQIVIVHIWGLTNYASTIIYYISFFLEIHHFMKAKREERNRVIYDLDGSNGDLVRPNHDAEDSIHMQHSNQENERRNYSLFNIENAWRVPDNPDT